MFFRLTIWTAVIKKDVQIVVNNQDSAEALRTITAANVGWLLGIGWMFYFGSLLLNLVYYLIHPSSPEMWTWGAQEKLEVWTPPEEKDNRKQSNGRRNNQLDASQIELAELLPKESDNDKIE